MQDYGLDMPDLTSQLAEDGVAFTNPELAGNGEVQSRIAEALAPNHGIAVVDIVPAKASDARNVAIDLQDATGLDTVLVQTISNISVVSDTYSRAEIEAVQSRIPSGIDQVDLLNQFYGGIEAAGAPWGLIAAVLAALTVLAFVASFRRGAKS